MANASASARRNSPTNSGIIIDEAAFSRAARLPSSALPRDHCASRTRPSSSAVRGMKRTANASAVAASSTGTRKGRSGARNPRSASVSSVEVDV